jgi:hypothetical protein
MAYTVFVSHSRCDQDLAAKVSDLARSVGAQVIDWVFESETQPASNTPGRIREADEVIAVVTTQSAEAPWLHWEIGLASGSGKPITTVMEGVDPSSLPPPLKHLQAVSAGSLEQLRQALTRRLLSDTLVRSGRAAMGVRRALCLSIGLQPNALGFLDAGADREFAIHLVDHIISTGDHASLRCLYHQLGKIPAMSQGNPGATLARLPQP